MTEKKFYTCKRDIAFKEVFMKEENKDLLIPLLELCLGIKINNLEYLNLEDNVDYVKTRRKSYDLRVSTNIGRIMIEINANIYDYSRMRQMSYISNEYSHIIRKGGEYDEEIDVIQINFTYGLMTNFREEYKYLYDDKDYRIYEVRDDTGKNYVKNFKIYEFNMDYYMNFWYDKNEEMINKYKFIIMMNLNLEELKELSKNNKVVDKYMEELDRVNKDPDFVEYMSYEEDLEKRINTRINRAKRIGKREGIEQGIEQGIEENTKEIALKMLKKGMPFNEIEDITNLSIEEIDKLNKSLK